MAKSNGSKRSAGRASAKSSSSKKTRSSHRGESTKAITAKSRGTAVSKGRTSKTAAGKGKVGGTPDAAKRFGGKLDFGIPSRKAHPAEHRVKERRDLSPSQRNGPEGRRVVGVGAYGWNAGHSGGAADTDIIGVGTPGGSSVSTDGTLGKRKGKDLTTRGGSAPFASGRRSRNAAASDLVGKVGGNKRVRGGSTNSRDEELTSGGGDDQTINPLTGGPARRELGGEYA